MITNSSKLTVHSIRMAAKLKYLLADTSLESSKRVRKTAKYMDGPRTPTVVKLQNKSADVQTCSAAAVASAT